MKYLADLKKIVLINSFTQNKHGVDEVGNCFIKWFEDLGYSYIRYEREIIGDHLFFQSKNTEGEKILLLGHLDTVFPINKFDTFTEDEEWVYGPGVCDMKGGLIVLYEALKNIKKKHKKIYNIDILLVSDEESGSDDSKIITAKTAKEYDYCFVFEAAGINNELVTGRKGIGTFKIDIEGKAAHAGNNYIHGIDANLEASFKIQKLSAITNLQKGTTVNAGKIEGGIGANTISPLSSILFEIRYENLKEKARILNNIDKIVNKTFVAGTKSKLSGNIQRDVMEPSPKQDNLLKSLEKISGVQLPTEKRGGVSDANVASSAGTVTLDGFGPFGDGDHTVNERALKHSFITRIDLVTKIFEFHQENKYLDKDCQ